jgi:hypothetical protein
MTTAMVTKTNDAGGRTGKTMWASCAIHSRDLDYLWSLLDDGVIKNLKITVDRNAEERS